jgi:hypothetical protein
MQALVTEMEVAAEQRMGVVDLSTVPDVPDAQELTRCAWRRMYNDARKRGVAT